MNIKKVLSGINEDFIKKGAADVNGEDIQKVVDRANDITQKVVNSAPLKRFVNDVKLLISMINDSFSGAYKHVPVWVIGAFVFALLYVLSPIDLIPDFIPIFGLVDDAAMLGLCLALTEKDIQKYQQWKELQEQPAKA
jgi:uncharacterized membrane protein YkvA (DUF1232 family)